MIRSTLILAAGCALAVAGCSSHSPSEATGTPPAPTSRTHQTAANGTIPARSTPSTSIAASPAGSAPNPGINLAWMDHSVNPGDNFFRYANGNWLKTAKIPADRASIGIFRDMSKRTAARG